MIRRGRTSGRVAAFVLLSGSLLLLAVGGYWAFGDFISFSTSRRDVVEHWLLGVHSALWESVTDSGHFAGREELLRELQPYNEMFSPEYRIKYHGPFRCPSWEIPSYVYIVSIEPADPCNGEEEAWLFFNSRLRIWNIDIRSAAFRIVTLHASIWQYRQRRGTLPETLSQLLDEELTYAVNENTLMDEDGRPWHYEPFDGRYALFSCGPDGVVSRQDDVWAPEGVPEAVLGLYVSLNMSAYYRWKGR